MASIALFTGLYVAYLFSQFGAKSKRTQEVFGSFKTAVEVMSLLRKNIGRDIDLMENKEIDEAIKVSNKRVVAQEDG